MKCYFTIYRANDGMCLLVGIDRNNIETGVTWGGEVSKKVLTDIGETNVIYDINMVLINILTIVTHIIIVRKVTISV